MNLFKVINDEFTLIKIKHLDPNLDKQTILDIAKPHFSTFFLTLASSSKVFTRTRNVEKKKNRILFSRCFSGNIRILQSSSDKK